MAEIGHQVSVNTHVDQFSVRADQVDQLDAHGLDVERRVLTQEKEDLQAVHVKELAGKFAWTRTVIISLVEE